MARALSERTESAKGKSQMDGAGDVEPLRGSRVLGERYSGEGGRVCSICGDRCEQAGGMRIVLPKELIVTQTQLAKRLDELEREMRRLKERVDGGKAPAKTADDFLGMFHGDTYFKGR